MKEYWGMLGLLLVTIIWGAGFTASDIALQSLEPFQIMAGRFLLAGAFLWRCRFSPGYENHQAGVEGGNRDGSVSGLPLRPSDGGAALYHTF